MSTLMVRSQQAKQREPWRSRGRRVAEPCEDDDDNDSLKNLPTSMRCGMAKIVRRKREPVPESNADGLRSCCTLAQSMRKPAGNPDSDDCQQQLRPRNKIGTRKIVRRERTPLPESGADGSTTLPTPSQTTSDLSRLGQHRVTESCNDIESKDGKKRVRTSKQTTMSKIVMRKRTPLSDINAPGSQTSPTPTQPKSDSPWVDLRDISTHRATAATLVEACQVLARSMPAPNAQSSETGTLDKPISDPYSTYLAGFAQQSLTKQPQDRSRRQNHMKRSSRLLDLPAEIRNLVYKHLVPASRILIVSSRPNKELQALNEGWSTAQNKNKRPPLRLYHQLYTEQGEEDHCIERNILLVSRQVKSEAEFFLYSRPTFRFEAFKNLTRFLNRAPKSGISSIENIELCDTGYANPQWDYDIIWQQRYYLKWRQICARAGQSLTGLKHLNVEADLYTWLSAWPIALGPGPHAHYLDVPDTSWKESVLQLAPRKIDRVEVELRHWHPERKSLLTEWKYNLENEMMTEAGQRRRDERETIEVLRRIAAKERLTALEFKRAIGFVVRSISRQDVLNWQHASKPRTDPSNSDEVQA